MPESIFTWNQTSQNALLQMRDAGVTSILNFYVSFGLASGEMPAATNQGYFPEWIVSSYNLQTTDFVLQAAPKEQSVRLYGVSFLNKVPAPEDWPVRWASVPNGVDYMNDSSYIYWPLLVLASGIQLAGPRLTAATLQSGLQRTRFPNPGAGAPPYHQATVGFGPGDRTFFDDASVVWWSSTSVSRENGRPGTYCYADGGARFRDDSWPRTPQPLFTQACW
jgi:hypothetical protein